MKRPILFVLFFILAGCAVHSKDMTSFEEIYEFEQQAKTCRSDNQCKLADIAFAYCSSRRVLVYSSIAIRGKNEEHLLALSKKAVKEDISRLSLRSNSPPGTFLEECSGAAPRYPHALCWKNRCEILYTNKS